MPPLKPSALLFLTLGSAGIACGSGGTDESSIKGSFTIQTPSVKILAGQEITYCYYFHTKNTEIIAVKQWASQMSQYAKDLTLVLTTTNVKRPGTQTATGCGLAGLTTPVVAYIARHSNDAFTFPPDDGTGKPVGQFLPKDQPAFLRVHYVNPTAGDVTVHAVLTATEYKTTDVTRADPFVTYNSSINVPAMSTATATGSCGVPVNARFFAMTMYTHKFATSVSVRDNGPTVYASSNIDLLDTDRFGLPFLTFATGKLTYQCDYSNPTNQTIQAGDGPAAEQCMAIAWFTPSTGPKFCVNSLVVNSDVALEGVRSKE